jgi:hypothetical protein
MHGQRKTRFWIYQLCHAAQQPYPTYHLDNINNEDCNAEDKALTSDTGNSPFYPSAQGEHPQNQDKNNQSYHEMAWIIQHPAYMYTCKNKPAKKPNMPSTARTGPMLWCCLIIENGRGWYVLACVWHDETQPAKMKKKEYYVQVIETMYRPYLGKQFSAYLRVEHTQKFGTILFCRSCPFLDDFWTVPQNTMVWENQLPRSKLTGYPRWYKWIPTGQNA